MKLSFSDTLISYLKIHSKVQSLPYKKKRIDVGQLQIFIILDFHVTKLFCQSRYALKGAQNYPLVIILIIVIEL